MRPRWVLDDGARLCHNGVTAGHDKTVFKCLGLCSLCTGSGRRRHEAARMIVIDNGHWDSGTKLCHIFVGHMTCQWNA